MTATAGLLGAHSLRARMRWQTVIVTWNRASPPRFLASDNMILLLVKTGELTAEFAAILVNATVVSRP